MFKNQRNMAVSKQLIRYFSKYNYLKSCTVTTDSNNSQTHNASFAKNKMQAWHIHSYGGLDELKLSERSRLPIISSPNDVLVKVNASSVNPIDVNMIGGYGSTIINLMRFNEIEFPLSLGRDFSGTVVQTGHNVGRKLSPGQQVWGVVPFSRQGCHAEYVLVDKDNVAPKPDSLSSVEASSILFTGLTAWNALRGVLNCGSIYRNQQVLVLGGAGGVGIMAVQMLKADGAKVFATCAPDAVELVEKLGVDKVFNYKSETFKEEINQGGPYHLVLDCAGLGPDGFNDYSCKYQTYVTLTTPLLNNTDRYGLLNGMMTNLKEFIQPNIYASQRGSCIKWAYFLPSIAGINYIARLVKTEKLRPIVQEVFNFADAPAAYEKVAQGHLRGKIVLDMQTS